MRYVHLSNTKDVVERARTRYSQKSREQPMTNLRISWIILTKYWSVFFFLHLMVINEDTWVFLSDLMASAVKYDTGQSISIL